MLLAVRAPSFPTKLASFAPATDNTISVATTANTLPTVAFGSVAALAMLASVSVMLTAVTAVAMLNSSPVGSSLFSGSSATYRYRWRAAGSKTDGSSGSRLAKRPVLGSIHLALWYANPTFGSYGSPAKRYG